LCSKEKKKRIYLIYLKEFTEFNLLRISSQSSGATRNPFQMFSRKRGFKIVFLEINEINEINEIYEEDI
jgi:hypothetical protein